MDLLQVKNFAFSTLASGILINGSSITLASGHSSRFPATGSFIAVIWGSSNSSPAQDSSRELVSMTFVSGDTYAITRAVEGTSAKAWNAGSNIACVITAGKVNELEVAAQNGLLGYAAATGANTYTAVLNPIVTSYVQGAKYIIRFNNASTGASTLALNSLAGKKLYAIVNGSYAAINSGHIIAGMLSEVLYESSLDGGAGGFIILNSNAPIYALVATTANGLASGVALSNLADKSITYAKIQDVSTANRILGRSASVGSVQELTVDSILSWLSTVRGAIIYRGASTWGTLSPGSLGQVLTCGGSGEDVSWTSLPAPRRTVSVKTGLYTVVNADTGKVFLCTGTWGLTDKLEIDSSTSLTSGFYFTAINNSDGGIYIIRESGSGNTINGELSYLLMPGHSVDILYDGTTDCKAISSVGGNASLTGDLSGGSTLYEFVDIPAWARKIGVVISNYSTNGTSLPILRVGPSAGLVATGYTGRNSSESGGTVVNFSTGFTLHPSVASSSFYTTKLEFIRATGNTWVMSGTTVGNALSFFVGEITLAGALTRLGLTTAGVTNVFDSGNITITWER